MKAIFKLIPLIAISLTAFADDIAPVSVSVGGNNADDIAHISSLSTATTGNSSYAMGSVDVSCWIMTPLNRDEQAMQEHYSCMIAKTVKINGDDADQIASLSFLYRGATGNTSSASGTAKVNCRFSASLNPAIQAESHFNCHFSAVHAAQ